MIKAILLDLDNTLLNNPDEVFAPAYLAQADTFFASHWGYPSISQVLLQVVQAVLGQRDMQHTNSEVALEVIAQATGKELTQLQVGFDEFYRVAYPHLSKCVEPIDIAPRLVTRLQELNIAVVIATNPIYPAEAIRQRLAWAGLPDQLTDYALVTSADNMHFAKPDPAFYAEIVARIGVEPDEAIMIGDSLTNDIYPAKSVGLHTYHVKPAMTSVSPDVTNAMGTLKQFVDLIDDHWLNSLQAVPLSPTMIEPELRGNIGALFGTISDVAPRFWQQHPDPEEWSPIQIICHLLESESTVQRPRLERIRAETNPFIAAPKQPLGPCDAVPCHEEGRTPAREFVQQRLQTIEWLKQLADDEWTRPARHSIFGPTTLLEMAHFTAQHDRLHINQLCQTLGRCT